MHLSEEAGEAPPAEADLDAGVVEEAMAGVGPALERLLVEAQVIAWRFGRTVCGNPDDAEDTMQEALIQTVRHIGQLRDARAFRPWLYRTVRNACLMSRRRRVDEPRRLLSLDALLPSPAEVQTDLRRPVRTPEEVVVNRRLRQRLDAAMAKLPQAFRTVVFLREMEGLSTRETATVLGISEDNVKARLRRARLFLQRELVGWGRTGDGREPRRPGRSRRSS